MRLTPARSFASLTLLAAIGCSAPDPQGPSAPPGATHPSPAPTGTTTGAPTGNPTSPPPPVSPPPSPPPPPPVVMTNNETWMDGKQLTASVAIPTGVTITIAPGAKVTAAAGVTISVTGTLTGALGTTHSTLGGASWGGIVVASGGTMTLAGVDLANAQTALSVQAGAASAKYDHGTISASATPFSVDKGGALSTTHSMVTGSLGTTMIAGSFTASYLDYDANGHEGLSIYDPSAVLVVDDSSFHGTGTSSGDMIAATAAASIHLGHSEIKGSHCAFHFGSPTDFDITYMNIHDNSYGFMLYGSGSTGTRSITYSNIFSNASYGADEGSISTVNGLITISNGYWAMNGTSAANNVHKTTSAITVTSMSTTTPVAGVGPR